MKTVGDFREKYGLEPGEVKEAVLVYPEPHQTYDNPVRFGTVWDNFQLRSIIVSLGLDNFHKGFKDWYAVPMPLMGKGYVSLVCSNLLAFARRMSLHGVGVVEYPIGGIPDGVHGARGTRYDPRMWVKVGAEHFAVFDVVYFQDETDAVEANIWYRRTFPSSVGYRTERFGG